MSAFEPHFFTVLQLDALIQMNPYRELVASYARFRREGKSYACGGFEIPNHPALPPEAPTALIFSPHPDDECIIGGLALRLRRECRMRVVNVAVTQGSNKSRQEARWHELQSACAYMGFGLIQTLPGGLEGVTLEGRRRDPAGWARSVNIIAAILSESNPRVVFFPHEQDWNGTHIGTHWLVVEALQSLGREFATIVVETEYWGQMAHPNLMVESSEEDVVAMVTGTSFHVGEVKRNPFHTLLPAWMQDNVRRGSEVVGGQGEAAPEFGFATLYRMHRWRHGGFEPHFRGGKLLGCGQEASALLA